MNRGDIYLVTLDPTLGREQQGSRPVLIVSPTAFNQLTKLPIICPITTGGDSAKRNGFAVAITGIQTKGVVRCDQPQVLDLAARHGRKLESLPMEIMDQVLARLVPLFST